MSKPLSIKLINFAFKCIGKLLPTKKRVLFLGTPRSKQLMQNTQMVYDELNCEKMVLIRLLPHKITDILYVSFYILTSKVIVLDDSYRYFAYIPLKSNQRLVQLWHGAGAYKLLGIYMNSAPYEKYTHAQYNAFISTSPNISDYFEDCLGLEYEVIKPLGYPVTDLILNKSDELEKKFYKSFPELKNKNIILYMPTYRRYDGVNVLENDYEIDWEQLNQFLEKTDSVFLVKRHPLHIHHNYNFVPDNYERIIEVGDVDSNHLLVGSDVLITDYSGCFFDYMLLNKPIIFYCTDAEEYLEKHGVYLNFPDDLPGTYCETFDELMDALNNVDDEVNYEKFKKHYIGSCDGHSTERVVKLIEEYYNE